MPTVSCEYLGALRVECEHIQSGARLTTDAPTDNHGKGAAFSPTDLCATALGACAMTIMGIEAMSKNLDISGARMDITKTMSADPRRIGKVEVIFRMPAKGFTREQKMELEKAANGCPVCLSLDSRVERVFKFVWSD